MKNHPWIDHYDQGVPGTIGYPDQPVFAFLAESAREYPDHVCTVCGEKKITFQEMEDLTSHLASVLLDLGVKRGDRVGIFLPNLSEFVIAFFAILKAGGVVAAINPLYKAKEFQFQVNDAEIKLLFAAQSSYSMVKIVQPSTTLQKIIVVHDPVFTGLGDQKEISLQEPDQWFETVMEMINRGIAYDFAVNSSDTAIFQYTGGTTGVPKAAVGLHKNLVANTLQFRTWLSNLRQGEEVFLMAIPMYHVYGMVLGMCLSIASAGTLVLVPNPRDIRSLLSTLERNRVTIFPGVPSLFGAIIRNADTASGAFNLKSIKVGISGSASLPEDFKRGFEALISGPLCEGYGLSEAPTATHCNPVIGENRIGSIGLPLPDVECRVVDMETGTGNVAQGEAGELVMRGPQVMQGYYNLPDETKGAIRDGWLYTGDIVRMDQDGYFYLLGRLKEVIKVSGFQVWPREVEEVIASHPKVLDVCVAGVPDERRGETVKAWVIARPGENLTEHDIRSWCERHLAYYKVPSFVEFRSEFPRTPVGKILRRELIREHLES